MFYSPEAKYPQVFINPRAKYMAEVLRQLACTYTKIVAIVDSDMMNAIEDQWMKIPRELQKLGSLLHVPKTYNAQKDKPQDI